jgi:endonuclease/exonuclease/phosphatase family metal-dependent hydrolase
VLCYNVRCDKDAAPFSWLQRKKYVRTAIVDCGAHILCLQETKQQYAIDLTRALGTRWRMCGVPRTKDDEGTQIIYDTAVFTYIDASTWVFHDEGVRRCPPATHCTERSFLGRRRCAHVRIFTHATLIHQATNTSVNIINTHFPLETFEQEICARQLAKYVEENTDTSWPLIICGDFNSHYAPMDEDTPLHMLLHGVPGLACAHDLTDFPTYHEAFEHDVLPPGKDSETIEHSHRLDYILARVPEGFPMHISDGQVHHPRYTGGDGHLYRPSDHEPLSAGFCITNMLH